MSHKSHGRMGRNLKGGNEWWIWWKHIIYKYEIPKRANYDKEIFLRNSTNMDKHIIILKIIL